MSGLRFFLHYAAHHRGSYLFGILALFVTNWLAVNIPVYIGNSIDLLNESLAQNYQDLLFNIYLVIGFASGPIPKIPLNLALLKGCSLVGVFWGRFAAEEPAVNLKNIEELWALFAAGKLSPVVTDSFSIDQYEQAFNCLIERRARGKVIMNF